MGYWHRELEATVASAARHFPAVVLTGPRRTGKTWLLQYVRPLARYFLLEDPGVVARLRADPQGFLDGLRGPVILDEVQNVPEVFAMVRARNTSPLAFCAAAPKHPIHAWLRLRFRCPR